MNIRLKFFRKKLENKTLRVTFDTGSLKEIPFIPIILNIYLSGTVITLLVKYLVNAGF